MIEVKVNSAEVERALRELARKAADVRPALQEIGEYLVETTKRRFTTKTGPDGEAWPANSDVTTRRKGSNDPLIGETGRLGDEIFSDASEQSVAVGSALKYAAAQQFGMKKGDAGKMRNGSPIPWGDIPPRLFLGLSDQDRDAVLDILREYLDG